MGKKGPLWWRESDWLLRGSSAANQILLRHSGLILYCVRKKESHVRNKIYCDNFQKVRKSRGQLIQDFVIGCWWKGKMCGASAKTLFWICNNTIALLRTGTFTLFQVAASFLVVLILVNTLTRDFSQLWNGLTASCENHSEHLEEESRTFTGTF